MVPGLGDCVQDLGLYPERKGGGVEELRVCDQIYLCFRRSPGCYVKRLNRQNQRHIKSCYNHPDEGTVGVGRLLRDRVDRTS